MLVGGGGAAPFKFTISSNQTNANLAALAITAGWDQAKAVEATVEAAEILWPTAEASSPVLVGCVPN